MRAFRKHSHRRRAPTFWIRGCVDNQMAVGSAHTSQNCDDQPVLAVDELAPGNPEFSVEDRKYTVKRIRIVGTMFYSFTPLNNPHMVQAWAVAVKLDIGMLPQLLLGPAVNLGDILNGGAPKNPSAMDVLGVWKFCWDTYDGLSNASPGIPEHSEKFDMDIHVARRLDANECLALLWGMDEQPPGASLPSASGFQMSWEYIRSTLYSESRKR